MSRGLRTILWMLPAAAWCTPSMAARPLHVRLTPYDVAAGTDRIPCEYRALPNRRAMDVRRIDVRSRERLHHILMYGYLGADRDPRHWTNGLRDGADCVGLGPPDRARHTLGLLGAVRAGRYELPRGYAILLLAEQPVFVQTHVFNHRARSTRAAVRVRFVPAAPGSVRHHLEPIDVTTEAVELPPGKASVRTADFVAPFDMHVVMVSSHQHGLGTRTTIRPVLQGVEGELVYENVRWREPPLRWIDPPLRLRAGDRLRLRCEWNNTTDRTVRIGPSAFDEMCNLNGFFHRDVELLPDARTGVGGFLQPVGDQ